MNPGYVYVLSNPAMPGLVKVGRTVRSVEARACELFQTGVPVPFVLEHEVYTPNCHDVELAVHDALAEERVSSGREFFTVTVGAAIDTINEWHDFYLREWLERFAPGYTIVEEWAFIDPADILLLASRSNANDLDIVSSFSEITEDEIAPALARWRAKVAARREAREAREAANGETLQ